MRRPAEAGIVEPLGGGAQRAHRTTLAAERAIGAPRPVYRVDDQLLRIAQKLGDGKVAVGRRGGAQGARPGILAAAQPGFKPQAAAVTAPDREEPGVIWC